MILKNGWYIKDDKNVSAEYEAMCNDIAERMGVKVPEYKIKDGKFYSRSFLRKDVEFVSFKDILGWKQKTFAEYVQFIIAKTRNVACAEAFMRVCLFDALIGNDDRHNDNIGFLYNKAHHTPYYRLAPSFDNHGALGCKARYKLKNRLRIKVGNEENTTIAHYAQAIIELGFKDIVDEFYLRSSRSNLNLIRDHVMGNIKPVLKIDQFNYMVNTQQELKEYVKQAK